MNPNVSPCLLNLNGCKEATVSNKFAMIASKVIMCYSWHLQLQHYDKIMLIDLNKILILFYLSI